jgi:hypothetical protein
MRHLTRVGAGLATLAALLALTLGVFAAVAMAVIGGMLLFRNRPLAAGQPIRTGG